MGDWREREKERERERAERESREKQERERERERVRERYVIIPTSRLPLWRDWLAAATPDQSIKSMGKVTIVTRSTQATLKMSKNVSRGRFYHPSIPPPTTQKCQKTNWIDRFRRRECDCHSRSTRQNSSSSSPQKRTKNHLPLSLSLFLALSLSLSPKNAYNIDKCSSCCHVTLGHPV
jgi:hypothetical protein